MKKEELATFSLSGKRDAFEFDHYASFEYPMPEWAKEGLKKL